jgi:hypothetical protein
MRAYAPVATRDQGEEGEDDETSRSSSSGASVIGIAGDETRVVQGIGARDAMPMSPIRGGSSDSDRDRDDGDSEDSDSAGDLHGHSRLRRHSSRLVGAAPWTLAGDWSSCARFLFSARSGSLRRCRSSLQRSCGPQRACSRPWAALRALLCLLLYVLLCLALMCALLLHTPLGRQGLDQSQHDADAEAYAALMRSHAAALHAKEAPLLDAPGNPSRSVAAALLPAWRMQLPPQPPDQVDVPVSPPVHPQGLILPRLPVAAEPPPFAHTLPLDTAAIGASARDAAGSAVEVGDVAPASSSSRPPYYPLGPSFVVVTYVSSLYFSRLLNLLGSLHTWEPHQRVVVYDLGCTQEQIGRMQCMDNVEVRPFNFSAVPSHGQPGAHAHTRAYAHARPLTHAYAYERKHCCARRKAMCTHTHTHIHIHPESAQSVHLLASRLCLALIADR